MILTRAVYLGAQRNGATFWSGDIVSTWDMLKRSVPAGLNFAASGMPYWGTDIAGFFSPSVAEDYHAEHKPLLDGSDVRGTIGTYEGKQAEPILEKYLRLRYRLLPYIYSMRIAAMKQERHTCGRSLWISPAIRELLTFRMSTCLGRRSLWRR